MNDKKIELTSDAVKKLWAEVFLYRVEPANKGLSVDPKIGMGLGDDFAFDPKKIKENKSKIMELLLQLPTEFMESSGGGGMSFVQACTRADGVLWTGEQARMEQLFVMGHAAGLVEYPFPKEAWPVLHGGVPYFMVKDK